MQARARNGNLECKERNRTGSVGKHCRFLYPICKLFLQVRRIVVFTRRDIKKASHCPRAMRIPTIIVKDEW